MGRNRNKKPRPTRYQKSCRRAGEKALELTRLMRKVALQKPHDMEAQRRARAATAFYQSVDEFLDPLGKDDVPAPAKPTADSTIVLPLEVLRLIISHACELEFFRKRTLPALCRSCKVLRAATEHFIYNEPRTLQRVESQWGFLFTATVEPHIGALVKSLDLVWLGKGENGDLMVNIARACPNVNTVKVQRGEWSDNDKAISTRDVLVIAALLDACPQLTAFEYSTTDDVGETEASLRKLDGAIRDGRFAKAAQRLVKLTLEDGASWLLRALSPHLSSNLRDLSLSGGFEMEHHQGFFPDLARRSPFLRRLNAECTVTIAGGIEELCKIWAPTLQDMCVGNVLEVSGWVAQVMPFMTALQRINLPDDAHTRHDLDAIARSSPPQRLVEVRFGGLELADDSRDWDSMEAAFNDSITRLITSHSSTLEVLELDTRVRLGPAAIQACKKATRLTRLIVGLDDKLEISDVEKSLRRLPRPC